MCAHLHKRKDVGWCGPHSEAVAKFHGDLAVTHALRAALADEFRVWQQFRLKGFAGQSVKRVAATCIPAADCVRAISRTWRSATASARVAKFSRIRLPRSQPLRRKTIFPEGFVNFETTNEVA